MVEENVNGQPEANSSDATDVKTEQTNEVAQIPTETPTGTTTEPLAEVAEEKVAEQVEQPPVVKEITDPDEKILNDMFESGKTEVGLNELVVSGFDTKRSAQFSFTIGQFKLTRLFELEPFKIEKIEQ